MMMIELRDPQALRAYLQRDLVGHAYQLSDLDPAFFQFTRWFGARDTESGDLKSLVLVYEGLRLPAVLASGEAQGVDSLLRGVQPMLKEGFYYHVDEHHLDGLRAMAPQTHPEQMVRMALRSDDVAALPSEEDTAEVVQLGHRDTGALLRLYRFYPDHFFEPFQLDTGLYFGIRREGELVSVAGVHAVSERDGVAALGNIVTHPAHRGQGLSVKTTGCLLRRVFERVGLATLNVRRDNDAAIKTFERLGLRSHRTFFEGQVVADGAKKG
jgi:ribosomal protein S18 acetylase RimI-like enzyme